MSIELVFKIRPYFMSGLKSGQVGVREWPLVERVAEQAQDGRLLCE